MISPKLRAFIMLSCAGDTLPLDNEIEWQRGVWTLSAIARAYDALTEAERALVHAHPDWTYRGPPRESTWFD